MAPKAKKSSAAAAELARLKNASLTPEERSASARKAAQARWAAAKKKPTKAAKAKD